MIGYGLIRWHLMECTEGPAIANTQLGLSGRWGVGRRM
jgi:hypothetical protein